MTVIRPFYIQECLSASERTRGVEKRECRLGRVVGGLIGPELPETAVGSRPWLGRSPPVELRRIRCNDQSRHRAMNRPFATDALPVELVEFIKLAQSPAHPAGDIINAARALRAAKLGATSAVSTRLHLRHHALAICKADSCPYSTDCLGRAS